MSCIVFGHSFQIFGKMKIFPKLHSESICMNCESVKDCPMDSMVKDWKSLKRSYGRKEIPSHLYDEYYIDEPDVEKDGKIVTWCPMYYYEEDISKSD